MKRGFWMILLVVGCGKATAPEAAEAEKPPTVVETADVSLGPMEETLTVPGSFVAADGSVARLASAVAGRWQTIFVREGDHVRAGQVLAVVDSRAQVAGAVAAKVAAQVAQTQAEQSSLGTEAAAGDQAASMVEAQAALRQAEVERSAAIDDAKNGLETAQADLARIIAGARPQEVAQARQTVTQAEIALQRAKSEQRRVRALAKEGFVSQRQVEEADTGATLAQSGLESARSALSLIQEGARPEEIRVAQLMVAKSKSGLASAVAVGEARVRQAQAALQRATAGTANLEAKKAETRAAQQTVSQRVAEAEVANVGARNGSVTAPFAGRVVRRMANPGDSADPAVPVLEIVADGATADFTASVSPVQASRLAIGMQASAVGQGSAGLEGRVISIGSADAVSGFVFLRIRGRAIKGQPRIGEFGTAKVVVSRVADAIRVPKAAIFEKEGASQCFAVVEGKAGLRKVQVSFTDDLYARVLSGVKPGEAVITLGQFELEDGAPVKTAQEKAP